MVKLLNLYIIILCTHLYHTHFFPVSIQYLQCIHCISQLLTIYQGVHITYFIMMQLEDNYLRFALVSKLKAKQIW